MYRNNLLRTHLRHTLISSQSFDKKKKETTTWTNNNFSLSRVSCTIFQFSSQHNDDKYRQQYRMPHQELSTLQGESTSDVNIFSKLEFNTSVHNFSVCSCFVFILNCRWKRWNKVFIIICSQKYRHFYVMSVHLYLSHCVCVSHFYQKSHKNISSTDDKSLEVQHRMCCKQNMSQNEIYRSTAVLWCIFTTNILLFLVQQTRKEGIGTRGKHDAIN